MSGSRALANGARGDGPSPVTEAQPAPGTDPRKGALIEALEALRNSQFAILQELRRGRRYRQQNPEPLEVPRGAWHGHCEACGAWYDDDDALIHHQYTTHPEIFAVDGDGHPELQLEPERCLCSRCSPGAYRQWLTEKPEESCYGVPLPRGLPAKGSRFVLSSKR